MTSPGQNEGKSVHLAAMDGDVAAIQRWLDARLFVDKRDSAQRTGLHQAAWSGRVEVVKLLLSAYAEVNARDNDRRTPLHYCSETGCAAVIKELIAFKADINAKDCKEETPLSIAARAGKMEAVKALLAAGASTEIKDVAGNRAGECFSSKVPPETRDDIVKVLGQRRNELAENKQREQEIRHPDNSEKIGSHGKEQKSGGCGCSVS